MKYATISQNSDIQHDQSNCKNGNKNKKYKEFTEERAKKLYEELMLNTLRFHLMNLKQLKKLEELLENSVVFEASQFGLGRIREIEIIYSCRKEIYKMLSHG